MNKKKIGKWQTSIGQDALSEGFHTSLRKYCDGHASSIAWNAISAMTDDHIYGHLTNYILERLHAGKSIREACLGWRYPEIKYMATILRISFELFTKDEWDSLAAGLEMFAEEYA